MEALDHLGPGGTQAEDAPALAELVQAGRLSSLVIRKANSFIIGQLKQFYLDRFVTITYDA